MTESSIIFYTTPNGQVSVQVQYEDGSFWLTQKRMAELFGVDVRTINEHLQNIYYSNELQRKTTVRKIRIVQQEGKELNRIVSAYLDLAENRATKGITTNMQEWIRFLNQFLELSQYPILQDNGKVSALEAKLKAEQEYETYRNIQDENYISDFDKEIKRIQGKEKS